MDGPGFEFRQGKEIFLLSKPSRPAPGPNQPPVKSVSDLYPGEYSDRGVNLATYLHLVLRLRISGAIRLLPLYAFMAWTGTIHLCVYLLQTASFNNILTE
jgi:hypothetical protein